MTNRITRACAAFGIVALMATILFGTLRPASAQTLRPNAPRELSAMWSSDPATSSVLYVKWQAPEINLPQVYVVYAAKGAQQNPGTLDGWKKIRVTADLHTTLTLSDLGIDAGQTMTIKVRALTVTNHDSLFSDGSVLAVAYWRTTGDNPIHFTTEPVKTGKVKVAYSYVVNAVATDSSVLTYTITQGPDGMTIGGSNTLAGTINWTPTQSGTYEVTVKASDAKGHSATQSFVIVVTGNEPQGIVQGTVTDSATGNGINKATLWFYPILNGGLGNPIEVHVGDRGAYDVRLHVGSYRVKAFALGYNAVYWDGTVNGDKAKILVVGDSGTYTVNIVLSPVAMGYIFGQITDGHGHGIAGAHVTAILKRIGPDSSNHHDFDGYGRQFEAETDSNGNYVISVPAGSYIIQAEARGFLSEWADSAHEMGDARLFVVIAFTRVEVNISLNSEPTHDFCTLSGTVFGNNHVIVGAKVIIASLREDANGVNAYSVTLITNGDGRYSASVPCGNKYTAYAIAPGFVGEYWENQISPLDANPIGVDGPTVANFNLQSQGVSGADISGTVFLCDSTLTKVPAKVTAYFFHGNELRAVATVYSDSLGAYTFHNLDTGVYLLQANPRELRFAPSYYTDNHTCAVDWHTATHVNVTMTMQSGLDIYCKKISAHRGFARLSGRVRVIGGAPSITYLAGGVVYALDMNGQVAGFAQTDTSGSFVIDNVDVGTFTLSVDRVQYQTVSGLSLNTDYDANAAPSGEITAQKQSASAVSDPTGVIPNALTLGQNYPNPFNPTTEIAFALPAAGMVNLSVYAVTGQKVATLVSGVMQAGSYHVTFDASNVQSGTYLYRLETAQGVVAKRMVELK